MANKVTFTMNNVPAGLDSMYVRVEEDALTAGVRNVLHSGVQAVTGNAIDIDIGENGTVGNGAIISADNYTSGGAAFKSMTGYALIESAGELLKTYDTIVGVGDSITAGEYDLSGGQYDNPYRGIKFKTGAQYGTTLFQMIENVTDFTSQAEGRTLFIVRAGINDCNTYLSAGGVGDGAAGSVLAWSDLIQSDQDLTLSRYRELVALLKQSGDVAISTITYCDAKGQLLPLADKGRDLHSGSWNDNTTVPLCQELTPEWFDTNTNRPIFDYYQVTYDNPSVLDDDNLHFYDDRTFVVPTGLGYTDGPGSYTIREHTLEKLGENTTMSPTPFDNSRYTDRVLVNIGRGNGLDGRPSFQRWANNLTVSSANELYENLQSYNGQTSISMQVNFATNGSLRTNLFTEEQAWDEGAGDTNCCSSGIGSNSSGSHIVEFNGLTKGTVSVAGIDSSEGNGSVYDPTARTVFEIVDDNGLRTVEVGSSVNGQVVTIQDCIATIDFDSSINGFLSIRPTPASGSTYGSLNSICIDIE